MKIINLNQQDSYSVFGGMKSVGYEAPVEKYVIPQEEDSWEKRAKESQKEAFIKYLNSEEAY